MPIIFNGGTSIVIPHAITHSISGSDPITPASIGAANALGSNDNYVTDAEKIVIGNTSGINTGDQDLSGYALTSSLSGYLSNTFETISKNLKSYTAAYTYSSGTLSSITYNTLSGSIVKSFAYTGGVLTSITLSGNTPTGISLTKTFTYSGTVLSNTSYS